jgi:histidinol-phosphate aminotransferase
MNHPAAVAGRSPQERLRLPDLRLDRVRHPYGPCPAALEAADAMAGIPLPALAEELRQRIAQIYRTAADAVSLTPSSDDALVQIVNQTDGPLIAFPPSAASTVAPWANGREVVSLARGVGRDGSITLDLAMDLPSDSIAMIASPSDPLGALLATADAVRLARACRYLIVDERFAEAAGFSLLHLSGEFDNIVIVRSFEYWAGIDDPPCAWAAAPPPAAAALGLAGELPRAEALAGALATLESLATVEATLRLLREERSRLFRFLRKLSFLEPIPSWGPFLPARVELVERDRVVSGLACRGVLVHAPGEAGLERMIRIGIGSRSAMDRLRTALLEVGSELLA